MKTFFLLFFLAGALLTGCSGNYYYASHKVTIYKTNSTKKEYSLFSVRGDSAIAVLDWAEAKVKPIPFSHVELIKRDSIIKIERDGHGGWIRSTLLGALAGLTIGELIAVGPFVFLGLPIPTGNPSSAHSINKTIDIGIISGTVIGSGISIIFPPTKELLLTSDSDRFFLLSISLYPDKEPEEMRYVK